jgi:glycosyltransferase involved in cell wall biosynthesis
MRTRIAILTDGLAPFETGGMQSYCTNLINALVQREDVQLMVFHTTLHGDREKAEKFSLPHPHVARYVTYPYGSRLPMHYLREQKKLSIKYFELLAEDNEKPVVIYAHGFTASHKGFDELKKLGIPVVLNLHGMNMFQPSASIKQRIQSFFLQRLAVAAIKNASGLITLGKAMSRLIPGAFKQLPVTEIPCAVSAGFLSGTIPHREPPVKLLFVGRCDKLKGMDVLIKALKEPALRDQPLALNVVGDWPTQMFEDLPQVKLLGSINDPVVLQQVYLSHQVLVLPSYTEGFPIVILEAMASGCSIVSTDVGCIPEIAGPDLIALAKPGNHQELAKILAEIIQWNDRVFDEKGQHARQWVESRYTWPLVAGKTYQFLISFVNKKP